MPSKKSFSHINHAISPIRHTPMYLMHKYWARKPHNVVGEYIENYSKKGDIVLDPFCGSGVTLIEALRQGRKAIAIDLDPIAVFVTKMTVIPVDLDKFQKSFENIKNNIKLKIESLYITNCPSCQKEIPLHYIVFEDEIPEMIHLDCLDCKKIFDKKFTREDEKRAKEIESMQIPFWYPTNELIWNTRVNVHKNTKVSDLFSKRNLIALSIILHEIEKIEENSIKNLMKLAFSSLLPQASKLLVYAKGQGPGWKVRGYWIPNRRYEMNVWRFFENRYRKVKSGKEESNEVIGKKYLENETAWILNQSSTDLSNISDSSVDYVFTDPPYGDSVPYLELNYIYSSWLKMEVNFDDEIIISDSPIRKEKNFDMYYKLLARVFREVYRVLKPGKWMTITFNNTNIRYYNTIIKAAILAGFDLEKIVYQPPAKVSAKAQLAPYGSAKGDYYIRFKKSTKEELDLGAYTEIEEERYERIIVEAVKKIIGEFGEPIPYSTIVNSYPIIYSELKRNGYLFSVLEGIDEILKRNINKEFVLVDIKNDNGKVIGQKWWLKDNLFLDRVPLSERVEAIIMNFLNKKIKVSFDEVLKEIYLRFTNGLTPDTQNMVYFLEEHAERTKDKKWRLKPKIKERENEHDSIVELLAKLGKMAGFNVHADISGWRDDLYLSRIVEKRLDRIKEIDALWYTENEIEFEFEVENTTGITEAIVRGSNIISKNVKRFIVIPEEREAFFNRKISEPMIKEKIEKDNWKFIFYDELKFFFKGLKQNKKLEISDFEKLSRIPRLKQVEQKSIQEFIQ